MEAATAVRLRLCFFLLLCVGVGRRTVLSSSSSLPQCSRPDHGKFWHVTDFHYDPTYAGMGLSCNAQVQNPSPLGDYWCDAPWRLVAAAIEAMASYPEDVDFVLWTGDTVAHISNDKLSEDLNMDLVGKLTRAISTAFPNTPVFPAFGNHDYYPASQFPAISSLIYNRTADLWRHWIQDEVQLRNFRQGGYYTRLLASSCQRLRMVVLNTNLYYTSDTATPGIPDPTGQLAWLRTVLQAARDQGEKVILAAHIPPGVHTPRGVLWYQEEFVAPVNKLLQEFADVIKAMHFGHDHYDGFKVFPDRHGAPAIPLFVAPSVTPWRFKLPSGEVGPAHNPALRLVTYDRHTGDHLNIDQFRLDLPPSPAPSSSPSPSPSPSDANFTLLYSFTQHYKVPDIGAASLSKLIHNMESTAQGDRLLDDYFRFASAGAQGDICDQECKKKIVCGFRHYSRAEYAACVSDNTIVPVG